MSKNRMLHDGSKIYDEPKYGCSRGSIAGYNCGFNTDPTVSVGSYSRFTFYWERQLFRELLTIFDIQMPEKWDKDYSLWVLFRCGYLPIVKTREYGWLPQAGQLSKQNVFYQPTKVMISNPLIKAQKNFTIGKDAIIIKLNPDYDGVWDLIHYYAEILAMMSQSLRFAIINTRNPDIVVTNKKNVADSFEQVNYLTDEGKPRICLLAPYPDETEKGAMPYHEVHNDIGKNYVVDRYQADIENCMNEFRRRVGIPVLSDKKERQVEAEVQTSINSALCASDVWFDCLTRSIEVGSKIWPELKQEFTVKKNQAQSGPEKAGDNDV